MRRTRPSRLIALAVGVAALASSTALASAASPATGHVTTTVSPATDWTTFEALAFETTLSEFSFIARDIQHPRHHPRLDWSTDLCSAPLIGNTGRSFDFTASCRRHDFGYRNLRLLERRWGWGSRYWNPENRERVDRRFLADMLGHCAGRSWWLRWSCRTWAWVYFLAVRTAGGLH